MWKVECYGDCMYLSSGCFLVGAWQSSACVEPLQGKVGTCLDLTGCVSPRDPFRARLGPPYLGESMQQPKRYLEI